jgi:hypothetical protein
VSFGWGKSCEAAIQDVLKKENTYIAGSMSLFGNIVVRFLRNFHNWQRGAFLEGCNALPI